MLYIHIHVYTYVYIYIPGFTAFLNEMFPDVPTTKVHKIREVCRCTQALPWIITFKALLMWFYPLVSSNMGNL